MKSQRKILVFAAIPAEIKAIQGRRLEPFDIDGLACLRLERPGGTRFTVCAGGIGRSAAVQSIKKVISTQKPDWIINTGSCGALSPEMTCGDIVVPGQLISMDRERRIRNQSIEKQHLDCVRISLEKENRCIHRCCLFSSEKPLCTIEEKKDARIQTGCGVVDMESFWVAETARMHECAVSVIRVVLDDARTELPAFSGTFRGVPVPGLRPGNLLKLPGIARKAGTVARTIGHAVGLLIDTAGPV